MSAMVRILVVGVGSIGERHVRCFQRTGRVSVVIAEPQATLRTEIAARYGIESAFESLDDALDSKLDAAVICTPAHLHVAQAIQCARRGLHLLIEKPLGINLNQVDELVRCVSDQQLVVAVAYVLRCHPSLSAMRNEIVSLRYGLPLQVVASVGQNFPTYRPAYRQTYYTNRATGGGAIQDALTHVINAAEWLVGPTSHVVADADHCVLDGVDVEDTVHVISRHARVMGCFSLNQFQAPNEFTLTVHCERGSLRFENHSGHCRRLSRPGDDWQDVATTSLDRDGLFVRQAECFLAALSGEQMPCRLAEGEQTLRTILAVLESVKSGAWVSVSPDQDSTGTNE